MEKEIRKITEKIVQFLVQGKFEEISNNYIGRLSREQIEESINDYPGTITDPSKNAYKELDIVKVDNEEYYMVDFDLWFDDEESDLTLSLGIDFEVKKLPKVEILNIRVQ